MMPTIEGCKETAMTTAECYAVALQCRNEDDNPL